MKDHPSFVGGRPRKPLTASMGGVDRDLFRRIPRPSIVMRAGEEQGERPVATQGTSGVGRGERVADECSVRDRGDMWITIVVVGVLDHDGRTPGGALVPGTTGHDAPAPGPGGIGSRDLPVTGIDDAEQIARRRAAKVGKGRVTPRRRARGHVRPGRQKLGTIPQLSHHLNGKLDGIRPLAAGKEVRKVNAIRAIRPALGRRPTRDAGRKTRPATARARTGNDA